MYVVLKVLIHEMGNEGIIIILMLLLLLLIIIISATF